MNILPKASAQTSHMVVTGDSAREMIQEMMGAASADHTAYIRHLLAKKKKRVEAKSK